MRGNKNAAALSALLVLSMTAMPSLSMLMQNTVFAEWESEPESGLESEEEWETVQAELRQESAVVSSAEDAVIDVVAEEETVASATENIQMEITSSTAESMASQEAIAVQALEEAMELLVVTEPEPESITNPTVAKKAADNKQSDSGIKDDLFTEAEKTDVVLEETVSKEMVDITEGMEKAPDKGGKQASDKESLEELSDFTEAFTSEETKEPYQAESDIGSETKPETVESSGQRDGFLEEVESETEMESELALDTNEKDWSICNAQKDDDQGEREGSRLVNEYINSLEEDIAVEAEDSIFESEGSGIEEKEDSEDCHEINAKLCSEERITEYIWINPIYAYRTSLEDRFDIEGDLDLQGNSETNYSCTSIEEAASLLRTQLSIRNTNFSVKIQTTEKDEKSLLDSIIDLAIEHSGNPTEGDYIAFQIYSIDSQAHVAAEESINFITYEFLPEYYSTEEQEALVTEKIKNVMSELELDGLSDYEKICAIYRYICENVIFDTESLETASREKFTAYAALVGGQAVCQGYSNLFYRMALESGIDCRIIEGTTDSNEKHSWNIVEIGDNYYYVDATWDAHNAQNDKEYQFFLRGSDGFQDHHSKEEYTTEDFLAEYPISSSDYDSTKEEIQESEPKIILEPTYLTFSDNQSKKIDAICTEDGVNLLWSSSNEAVATVSQDGIVTPNGNGGCIIKVASEDGKMTETCSVTVANWDVNSKVISSGTCGDDAYWVLTEDGTLTISGTGEMYDSEIGSTRPWYSPKTARIVIEEGITKVGNYSFYNKTNPLSGYKLAEVELPESLKEIGNGAFYDCVSLVSINMPSDLSAIGKGAFENCVNLKAVDLPDNVSSIGADAFKQCGLVSISIPECITTLESGVFRECRKLIAIIIPETITSIGEYAFTQCNNLTNVIIPDTVSSIGHYAFSETGLIEVILPDSITDVGRGVFSDCTKLQKAVISQELSSISYEMFNWCSSLEEIELPARLKSIGSYAFCNCTSLKRIEIPDTVESIGAAAFGNCSSLEFVNIPDNVKNIYDETFAGCVSLKDIMIPESVESIGYNPFRGCNSLRRLNIPGSVSEIQGYLPYNSEGLSSLYFLSDIPETADNTFEKFTLKPTPDSEETGYSENSRAVVFYPYQNSTWLDSGVVGTHPEYVTWVAWDPNNGEVKGLVYVVKDEEGYVVGHFTSSDIERLAEENSITSEEAWELISEQLASDGMTIVAYSQLSEDEQAIADNLIVNTAPMKLELVIETETAVPETETAEPETPVPETKTAEPETSIPVTPAPETEAPTTEKPRIIKPTTKEEPTTVVQTTQETKVALKPSLSVKTEAPATAAVIETTTATKEEIFLVVQTTPKVADTQLNSTCMAYLLDNSGTALADASLTMSISSPEAAAASSAPMAQTKTVSKTGYAAFSLEDAGTYSLALNDADGKQLAQRTVTIQAGVSLKLVDDVITVPENVSFTMRLRYSDGKLLIEGVEVLTSDSQVLGVEDIVAGYGRIILFAGVALLLLAAVLGLGRSKSQKC